MAGYGKDVLFVERPFERGAAMSGGADEHALPDTERWAFSIVRRDKLGYVDKHWQFGRFSRKGPTCDTIVFPSIFPGKQLLSNDVSFMRR